MGGVKENDMAERLTVCIDSHLLDNGVMVKEYSLNNNIKLNQISVMDIPNAVYDKLGELEDVMDEYGIESYDKMKQDRNTWKRACELACETLKQVMGKPLWIGGNIPAPEVKDTEYFYQQAKKEGNDERN